ncbi:MAG: phosphoribosylformylglycinamidine cyclo-ligase [Chloroflexi bacterium]|nr:phosphoribosylformylglycinamidine cyclo-ligase [Chloroflexota bacterium]
MTYRDAGVNLDAAQDIKERIKAIVAPTHGSQVLGGVGGFSALYRLGGYKDPVLVSSTDGVGTKLKLAIMMGRYDTIGEDLVNACINDIIVCGAEPLFFLDYLAVGVLENEVVEALIAGMARACEQASCALIGGETAQMPGLYADGDFDMAGFVVGAVERDAILDGSDIRPGDTVIGIPSNGLHTNGYSLVRHALGLDDDPSALNEVIPELGEGVTLGDALLMPHPSYVEAVRPVLPVIKGMAHITGGGLVENVPRILPEGTAARFDSSAWRIPPIFTLLQERAAISREEMYRVFNMGIGMALVCDHAEVDAVLEVLSDAEVVGEVMEDEGGEHVSIV